MKLLTRFLTFVMSLLLSSLIIAWSTLAVLGSATTVNGILVRTKVYDLAAIQARASVKDLPTVPEQYKPIFAKALDSALTTDTMEQVFQPLLVDVISWLNQPGDTPPPTLIVSLTPIRTAVLDSIRQAGLSPLELTVIEAQINQKFPNQLDVTQVGTLGSGGLATTSQVTPSPTPQAANPYTDRLVQAKNSYENIRIFANYGLIALALLTIALILLSRYQGRAMLRRPAWVFINAGVLTLVCWAIVLFVSRSASTASVDPAQGMASATTLASLLAREVMGIVVWYGLASLLTGGVLYGLSFFIHKAQSLPPAKPMKPVSPPTAPTSPTPQPTTTVPQPPLAPPTAAPSDPSSAASPTRTVSTK